MNPEHDFSRSPRQRQRCRETGFYYMLGGATALAAAAVMALDWRIEVDSARLQAASGKLQAELRQLQPRLAQVTALEASIATQHQQLQSQVAQDTQRAFAPRALHALAAVSPTHIRLHQIMVRSNEAEILGAASDQRQLQDLVESLQANGLGQVKLQELRQELRHDRQQENQESQARQQTPQRPHPTLPYSFTLRLTDQVATPAASLHPHPPPQPPAQSSPDQATQAPRARRT